MGYFDESLSYMEWVEIRDGRETLIVTEENISKIRIVPCEPVLPKNWKGKSMYRLSMDIEIFGELIPEGYIFDGASVPRALWSLYPPVGRYLLAALIHDWKLDNEHGWSVSNDTFNHAMRHIGIVDRRRWVMHGATRLNGWVKSTFFGEPK